MPLANKLALDFVDKFEHLRNVKGEELTIGDIDGLLKHLRDGNQEDLYEGIADIAKTISKIKVEMGSVHPGEIGQDIIPGANHELDAVVKAAEDATNQILDSVEVIQEAASGASDEIQQKIMDEVTKIFEACNFQDITGQRVGKVLTLLLEVEASVDVLMNAIADHVTIEVTSEAKDEDAPPTDEDLMNGPQLKAPSQEDIDRLFAG